ncbi:hypothetical protein ACD582_07645, partial [Xanthomonas nasturtii]|uniref:hypothetical protein n=1 Tax=Xanthomonas nasturtii TaxID=1843581 RepID=UPI003556FC78
LREATSLPSAEAGPFPLTKSAHALQSMSVVSTVCRPGLCITAKTSLHLLPATARDLRRAEFHRANDLLLCVRHIAITGIAHARRSVLSVFQAASERIHVERRFFRVVSSFAYWRRAAVALHFALPTGSADPTPPTNTEHITHGKNRR